MSVTFLLNTSLSHDDVFTAIDLRFARVEAIVRCLYAGIDGFIPLNQTSIQDTLSMLVDLFDEIKLLQAELVCR